MLEKPFEVLAEMKRKAPGGKTFEYNSINTFVLSRIVENVRGLSMNEIVGRDMWQEMGGKQ